MSPRKYEENCKAINRESGNLSNYNRLSSKMVSSEKIPKLVTPAEAGVHNFLKRLDSGFRRNDNQDASLTFYESIKNEFSGAEDARRGIV